MPVMLSERNKRWGEEGEGGGGGEGGVDVGVGLA